MYGPNLELLNVDPVRSYIQEYSSQRKFALVYFELMRRDRSDFAGSFESTIVFTDRGELGAARPNKEWKDRIKLHRRIIEHTSNSGSFPAPALFLEVDALPDFSGTESSSISSMCEWNNSILRYIETWIEKTEILKGDGRLFDLILVDTAPWYPTISGRMDIPQESAVWVAQEHGGYTFAKEFLSRYQDNTARLQKTRIGPFLHPHFTGQNEPTKWRDVQFTTNEQSINLEAHLVNDMIRLLDECQPEYEEAFIHRPKSILDAAYTISNLENLDVSTNIIEYNQEVHKRLPNLRKRFNDSKIEKLYSIDLNLCHQAMHQRLDRLVSEAGWYTSVTSTLTGIPITIASTSITKPENQHPQNELPETYRGGIWIYAITRGDYLQDSERYLFDLIRLLHMHYELRYSELAYAESQLKGKGDQLFSFAHQTSSVIDSIIESLKKLPDNILQGMSSGLITQLHLLHLTINSYRDPKARVDPGNFPYPWMSDSPLTVYRNIGIELGFARAINAPDEEPQVKNEGRLFFLVENHPDQSGFSKYQNIFDELPSISEDIQAIFKHSSFAILIIMVFKQAVYHTIRAFILKNNSEKILVHISDLDCNGIIKCVVENPHVIGDKENIESKDADELSQLANRLSSIGKHPYEYSVDGPHYDGEKNKWITSICIEKNKRRGENEDISLRSFYDD